MAGSRDKADPLVLLGRKLMDRYAIVERMAQGGMSVIYRGQDERLQRPVCVKVFFGLAASSVAHVTGYEHFVQEAFALSQLRHPHTIRIYDFGYLDMEPHSPFHVSELMEGGTLRHYLDRHGPLPVAKALTILEPIVGALAEAHSYNVVHRDIKPANILFGRAGPREIFKLADFGIAKAYVDEQSRAIPNRARDTRAHDGRRISLYSPGWAAPEQLRGRPVGPASDVFALGLVTAFMLTGKRVFSDDDFRRVLERSEGDAYVERSLGQLRIPPSVQVVLKRACRVDPSERPQTVEAFFDNLRDTNRPSRQATQPLPASRNATQPGSHGAKVDGNGHAGPGPGTPEVVTHIEVVGEAAHPNTDQASAATSKFEPMPSDAVSLRISEPTWQIGKRWLRMLHMTDRIDLESLPGPEVGDAVMSERSKMRLRLTLLPERRGRPHLHLKGLNCFIAKPGSRVTNAVNLDADVELEVFLPEVQKTEKVRCLFGSRAQEARLYTLEGKNLAVPTEDASRSVILDFGVGRDPILVYRAMQLAKGVG